ncbi:MAG: hydrogenase nickel incorporation protein HypB [Thermodesulfobacteriota bacterium]|nr:hydrogenase nickel incorporation protein HypB [Thermodesulfobacteriota bacterium]
MKVPVVRNILEANERIADQNRHLFNQNKVFVLNLMSSPGAGKTSLLEQTIDRLKDAIQIGVIEGDITSSYDAERIAKKGIQTVQINTEGACHLDGNMIREAVNQIDLPNLDLLIIENVGNLVCPAEFNVGEDAKAMILSVPEGDDKPLKYPLMFTLCKALIINKIDLLPYVDCSMERIRDAARKLNSGIRIFEISCRTGQGVEHWCTWLGDQIKSKA